MSEETRKKPVSDEEKKLLDARIENLMNFDIKKNFYESPIEERKRWVNIWTGMAAYINSIDEEELANPAALQIVPGATPEEVKKMKDENIEYPPWWFVRVNIIKEVVQIGIDTLENGFYLDIPFQALEESYKRGLNKLKDIAVDKIGDKEFMDAELEEEK